MGRGDRLLFACLIKYHGKQLMYSVQPFEGKGDKEAVHCNNLMRKGML